MSNEAACKGCGKKILWIETVDGKRIPLDPSPPVYSQHYGTWQRNYAAHVTHVATCGKHRRKATA